MASVIRKMLNRCAVARATLLQPAGLAPFGQVAGTPLERVADHYLAIITGSAVFGSTGSATVLRPGLAVTCGHVVEGLASLTVLSRHGPLEARVAVRSERLDLALLDLPAEFGAALPIAAARVGQPVWAMGTTTGTLAPTAAGRVDNDRAVAWLGSADGPAQCGLMYSAEAGPGYSGGPLVDAEGALVGITEGIYTRLFGESPMSWRQTPRMFAYRAADVAAELNRLNTHKI